MSRLGRPRARAVDRRAGQTLDQAGQTATGLPGRQRLGHILAQAGWRGREQFIERGQAGAQGAVRASGHVSPELRARRALGLDESAAGLGEADGLRAASAARISRRTASLPTASTASRNRGS